MRSAARAGRAAGGARTNGWRSQRLLFKLKIKKVTVFPVSACGTSCGHGRVCDCVSSHCDYMFYMQLATLALSYSFKQSASHTNWPVGGLKGVPQRHTASASCKLPAQAGARFCFTGPPGPGATGLVMRGGRCAVRFPGSGEWNPMNPTTARPPRYAPRARFQFLHLPVQLHGCGGDCNARGVRAQ